jgi:hypothetical protein
MSELTVGAPRDRQLDLRIRLEDQEMPEERSVQELHRIARSRPPEPEPVSGFWAKLRRKG